MKRISYLMLALLTVVSAAACADSDDSGNPVTTAANTDTTQTSDAATVEPSLLDSLGEKDLGGYTYTIFDCNAHAELQVNMPGEEMTGEVVNDALIQRDTYLEEKYNCTINYFQEDDSDKLKAMVSAGDDDWQLMIDSMADLGDEASAGYLANLCAVPYLEMDKEWWNPLLYENLRLHDAMYVTSSDIAPGIYQMPTCLFLNLKLYTDYDIEEDIFQMVIDGTWTIDELEKMTKGLDNDLNADNKWSVDDDFFGFAMHDDSAEAVLTMLVGSGVKMSHLSEDGDSITTDILGDSHAVAVIERISDLFFTIDRGANDEINDFSNVLFKSDRALFFLHKLESAATHLRDMESDYLILPAPKWDAEQESYYSFLSPHGSCFIGVPMTAQENENAGFLTEALARYSNQYVRPIAFDLVYKQKDSRDPRTVDVLDILLNSLYIDFTSLYNFGDINDALNDVIYEDKPLVSTVEKRMKSCNKNIAKLVESWMPVE